jgi:hypothetical protein
MSNKRNNSKRLPSQVEIFQSTRSTIALTAILRSGAGKHQDKRRAPERKNDWRKDSW